jgi:hypothetical protein
MKGFSVSVRDRYLFHSSKKQELSKIVKRLKSIFAILMLFSTLLMPNYTLLADNNAINGTCPGEVIEEINGTTSDVSHREDDVGPKPFIGGGGNDRYRMTFNTSGVLNIDAINRGSTNNANYYFYISKNNCGNDDADWNIVSKEYGNEHHHSVLVYPGDTIYVRLQSIATEPNKGRQAYYLDLDFKAVQVCANSLGLDGKYYNNTSFSDPLALERSDLTIDFDWGSGSPDPSVNSDSFSTVWEGYVSAPEDANYIFSFAHDDALKVTIDGTVVYDSSFFIIMNRATQNADDFRDGNSIHLSRGCHTIKIEYKEYTDDAFVRMKWRNDVSMTNSEIVSSSYLFHSPVISGCHGCDCSLDDNTRNSTSPGIAIPGLDGATSDISKCISGITDQADGDPAKEDYYHFKIGADGNVTIRATSPNSHDYHFTVWINGTVFYPDTTASTHNVPTLILHKDDEVVLKFKETGDDLDEYQAEITFDEGYNPVTANPDCANPHKFETRLFTYIPGDLVAIGNSNICADDDVDGRGPGDEICDSDQKKRNDLSSIIYVNKYSSPELANVAGIENFKNISSATLSLPAGATVKWAGLYWQGSIWNFRKGVIINNAGTDSGDDGLEMLSKEDKVIFKTPVSGFDEVQADEHYWINLKRIQRNWGCSALNSYGYGYGPNFGYSQEHSFYYEPVNGKERYERHYQGFKDVTKLLQDVENANGTANGDYWVGNIQSTTGQLCWPGVESGWTLVVVYENKNSQPRSISVTDGYLALYNFADQGADYANDFGCPADRESTGVYGREVSFEIKNILTPKRAGFMTDMTVFVTESDPEDSSTTEYLKVTKKDGSDFLVDGYNAWNYEITNKDGSNNLNRLPNYIYPIGLEIKNYRLKDALDPEQNSTTVTFSTDTDKLILGVIGFATDMRAPELCYDLDVRLGDYMKLNLSDDRSFKVTKVPAPLQAKVLIRSKEADFDFEKAKLHLEFNPDNNNTSIDYFDYREGESKISEGGTSIYVDATETNTSIGEIAIGHNRSSEGGVLYPEESTYVREYFDINNSFEGSTNIIVNGEVRYTSTMIVPYKLSTDIPEGSAGHIGRCETSPVYDPIWGKFNVESEGSNFSDPDEIKYPIQTQIARKPFHVSVASYDADPNNSDNAHNYTVPKTTTASIELEIIDASVFENNSSTGYDATCEEPSSISRGLIVKFNNQDRVDVDMNKYPGFYDLPVLRDAAFRIWELYYHDSNGTLTAIDYPCTRQSDASCFEQVYDTYYKNGDDNDTKYCANHCSGSQDTECYDCLRSYFGKPVCSRDNFSIRPSAFHVKLSDNNESDNTNPYGIRSLLENNSSIPFVNLAVGYPYVLDIQALDYNGTDLANGYYNTFDKDYSQFSNQEASLVFNSNKTNPSSPDCNDTTKRALDYTKGSFAIASSKATVTVMGIDAGYYNLNLVDKDWTAVDQKDYVYQTKFNNKNHEDCFKNSPDENSTDESLGKYGCYISSEVPGVSPRDDFKEIGFYFMPYRFSIIDFNLTAKPDFNGKDFIYMNDLDKSSDVGVLISGRIKALGKNGETLYNFTESCAAKDVDLKLDIEIKKGNIVPSNPSSVYAEDNITEVKSKLYYNETGTTHDINETFMVLASKFAKDDNGSSQKQEFLYNLQKPYDIIVNATEVGFNEIKVKSTDSQSLTHMKTDYTPEGNITLNGNYWFMFGRVEKPNETNPTKYEKIYDDSVNAIFYVDIYCRDDVAQDINCSSNSFTTVNSGLTNSFGGWWYRSDKHQSTLNDGKILNLSKTSMMSGDQASLSQETNIFFTDGISDTITVSYPRPKPRPQQVVIKIEPDEWLKYDPDSSKNGIPEFSIYFLDNGFDWKGIGDTGKVVDNNKTSPVFNKRLNW